MVYTWRRGYATQSAVSLSRPFAFARTGAPRTPFSPLWWGWIRLEPTAVNICANFFPSKNCAHICEKVCGNCFNPKFCRNNCAQIYAFLCNANFCEIFWENTCGKQALFSCIANICAIICAGICAIFVKWEMKPFTPRRVVCRGVQLKFYVVNFSLC